MAQIDVPGYLARIGAKADDSLADLQHAHLLAVPFENLSVHLDEPYSLAPADLCEKVVTRRRGGFCYELNGLFAVLLTELGHRVELRSARPRNGERWGSPLDHLALVVNDDVLVDVGFGAHSTYPLRLDTADDQPDPGGVFRVRPATHGEFEVTHDGEPAYLVEARPYELRDFAAMCWWQSHSPDTHFTRSLVCSRLTESGRVTLSGRKLIETVDGARQESDLDGGAAVLGAYRDRFGIALDRVPQVRAR
ncbi:arylamine N-acetyltransferase [Sporichthya sp.]|uniref:arylamine N-acetyltransferase family protein n=1 Tax=Sporichthya sp. TaxID=65475 RepID=UPI001842F2E0|nr:arylamine N-acetyltransferase [Sporichthya sp.]MBA3743199.1 arylamine N-acetyltransferase [Sporichthya sp.]